MIQKTMVIMALSVICCSMTWAGDLNMDTFIGVWEVDYDRTLEESKNSPKYDEKMAERMPAMIKRMMGTMKIKLTEEEMVYARGAKEIKFPYTVKSSDAESVTISIAQEAAEITVVFTLVDEAYMGFKSSASDDMHYYVWAKATEMKGSE